jgi:hypothetical protein
MAQDPPFGQTMGMRVLEEYFEHAGEVPDDLRGGAFFFAAAELRVRRWRVWVQNRSAETRVE